MQILLNGLCNGMVIALLAIAYTIVYLPTKVFFIALAGVYGGYNDSEIVGTPNYPSPILEHGKNGKPTLVIDD